MLFRVSYYCLLTLLQIEEMHETKRKRQDEIIMCDTESLSKRSSIFFKYLNLSYFDYNINLSSVNFKVISSPHKSSQKRCRILHHFSNFCHIIEER